MSLSPSRSETNYWIIGHASSTSEDVYSSVSKGSVSGSSRISSCDFRTACPVLHGCSSLRQWVASSSEPSTGTFNAQLVNDFLITFVGNSAQESRIHCKIVFDGGAFKFPAAVSSCCLLLCAGSFKWFVPTYVWRLYVLGTTYGDNHAVDFVGFERVGNTVLKVTFVRVPS